MLDDLKTVIRRFKPTSIFAPHPNDTLRDHYALYGYTQAALYELGMLDRVRVRLYLVHRGDWPAAARLPSRAPVSPPPPLLGLGTRWEVLPLPRAVAERKRVAILRYRSQVLVMRRTLLSFARSGELFGELPAAALPRVPEGRIKVDGDPADWRGIEPVIRDPGQDLAETDVSPSGDLVAVYAARSRRRLFVRLELWGEVSPELYYHVHYHPLVGGRTGPPQSWFVCPGRPTRGAQFGAAGRCVELSVPLPGSGALDGLILGADSRFQSHLLDRTAWALLKTGG